MGGLCSRTKVSNIDKKCDICKKNFIRSTAYFCDDCCNKYDEIQQKLATLGEASNVVGFEKKENSPSEIERSKPTATISKNG